MAAQGDGALNPQQMVKDIVELQQALQGALQREREMKATVDRLSAVDPVGLMTEVLSQRRVIKEHFQRRNTPRLQLVDNRLRQTERFQR